MEIDCYRQPRRSARLLRLLFDRLRPRLHHQGMAANLLAGGDDPPVFRPRRGARSLLLGMGRRPDRPAQGVHCDRPQSRSRYWCDDDRQSTWLNALVARRGFNRTTVAIANKTARIAWVLLSRK